MCYSHLRKFSNEKIPHNALQSLYEKPEINFIKIFALGPDGTNIVKAAKEWIAYRKIQHKSEIVFCSTPITAIEEAQKISDKSTLPIFVLCAVYNKLHELFFTYCDCYFFLDHLYMPLDKMQLASKKILFEDKQTVASHPSPSVLLNGIYNDIHSANSNSHAAILCSKGEAAACITTESARSLHQLKTLHVFGSPVMLFTFGTTAHGISLLKQEANILKDVEQIQ
ncbi:hypothetical protein [Sporomusa sphaeroides]|uniref:hypothetical protein n=1 Tax=Sporomusa sphaeroides TaxID=47679 RepID=UPI002D15B919|nr:hypothetical protein [Sporomusa sphaeroides]HML33201.1 hypothetical protein [Sporomusa sphaeroides]